MRVHNTMFVDNRAVSGGAAFGWIWSSSVFYNCHFVNNTAVGTPYFGGGGGVALNTDGANATYDKCVFSNNYASRRGGALFADYGSWVSVKDCTFEHNRAYLGGALFADNRAARIGSTGHVVSGSTFRGNAARLYGGASLDYNQATSTFATCTFIKMISCTFEGNDQDAITMSGSTTLYSLDSAFDDESVVGFQSSWSGTAEFKCDDIDRLLPTIKDVSSCIDCVDVSSCAAPSANPTSAPMPASPTFAPSEPRCADSVSWHYKKSKHTCDSYVSKKSKRCKRKDEFDVEARLACALTCGECEVEDVPAPAPTVSECVDSTSWFYKKSKNSCDRFVSKKAKNCKKRDEFDVKARLACPMTCGECAE